MNKLYSFLILLTFVCITRQLLAYQKHCRQEPPNARLAAPFQKVEPTYSYVKDADKYLVCYVHLTDLDKETMQRLIGTYKPDGMIEIIERELRYNRMARTTLRVLKQFKKYKEVNMIGEVRQAIGIGGFFSGIKKREE